MMIRVEQVMRLLGERLAEVVFVDHRNRGVLMREAKIAFAVLFIENRSSFFSHEGTVYDRLSAAADTSARAGHDFDEIIGNLTLIEGCQKLVGIAESIDNSNLKLDTGRARSRVFSFAD